MSEEKRIAIFYDGYYFYKVNQFYERVHKRNAPIKIAGLHRFIVSEVANELKTEISLCRIVESHYFMGTSPNPDRDQTGFEYNFTVGGVSAHRLPLMKSYDGIRMLQEKGVDVLLALEAEF